MTPDLTRLTELLPPPHLAGRTLNEDRDLPADFKELLRVYGAGLIDNYLLLLEPGCPDDVYDQVKISAEREEANAALWVYDDRPAGMEADGNRLVCWGTTDNGEYLYWLVRPGDEPDRRPVLVNGDSAWEWYDMTVTRFLVALLNRDVRSEVLWGRFPQRRHEFLPPAAPAPVWIADDHVSYPGEL